MSKRLRILLLTLWVLLMVGVAPSLAQPQYGTNWSATYYRDPNCSSVAGTQTEAAVNFNYGGGGPALIAPQTDGFCIRFNSSQTLAAGTYTFTAVRDNYVTVSVNGNLIINQTAGGGVQTFQATVAITGGAVSMSVEYRHASGDARIEFYWQLVSSSTTGGGSTGIGQTFSGNISSPGASAVFTFVGNANDVVTITCTATQVTLDPTVTVLAPGGTEIAFNDDISFPTNLNAQISNLTLPSAGTYSIVVRGFGSTVGTFSCTLSGSGTGAAVAVTASVVRVRGLAVRSGPYLGASLLAVARPEIAYRVIARNRDEGIYTWYLLEVPIGVTASASTPVPGVPTAVPSQVIQGWSSGRYLELTGDPNTVPLQSTVFDQIDGAPDVGVVGVTRAAMNFRRRPSIRSAIVAPDLPWGAVVTVVGITLQGGDPFWLHVRYNGQIGWIYAPFVSLQGNLESLPVR